jgi:site-specific DNA recombinase
MNVAIYIRVSTAEQAEKGYSIDTQLEASHYKAKELGATHTVDFIDDGYSGEYIDRPALSRLRDALFQKKFDAVIVYDPDRLARNLAHLLIVSDEIDKSGAQLLFVIGDFDQTAEGKLFYSMRGAVAEYEKEKIKERTLRGKRGKAQQGKIVVNGHPLGYNFDSHTNMYIINEKQAELVRKIFNWYTKDHLGTVQICKKLNALGISTAKGRDWISSSIYRILTNTIYKGIVYSMRKKATKISLNKKKVTTRPESEWIPIAVPAIIDEVTWQTAQKQLKLNKDSAKRNLKREHLLNGLVYCAKCNRKMVITHSGHKDKPICYYVCLAQTSASNIYSESRRCPARRVPTLILDTLVWSKLSEMTHNSNLIKQYMETEPDNGSVTTLKNAILEIINTESKLRKQQDNIIRWYRQQMIDINNAEKQLQEIRTQLANLVLVKKSFEEDLQEISFPYNSASIVTNIKLHFNYDVTSEDEKRAAIRSILNKVTVERTDDTIARGSKPEFNISIDFI